MHPGFEERIQVSPTDVAGAAKFRRRNLTTGEQTVQASPAYTRFLDGLRRRKPSWLFSPRFRGSLCLCVMLSVFWCVWLLSGILEHTGAFP